MNGCSAAGRLDQPFFIVGCPRSGTTLLQVMLSRHPRLVLPPELKLFHRFHRASGRVRRRTVRRLRDDLAIDLDDAWADRCVSTRRLYAEIRRQWIARSAENPSQGQALLGDKTPEHSLRMRWVLEEYPAANVLVVLRDPRDVVDSLMRVPWLRCDEAAACRLWVACYREILRAETRCGRSFHWIRFEELVRQPKSALHGALAAVLPEQTIDNEVLESMTLSGTSDHAAIPRRELDWKRRALDPPDSTRCGLWRGWSPDRLAVVESRLAAWMTRFGYKAETEVPRKGQAALDAVSLAKMAVSIPGDVWWEEFRYRLGGLRHV